MKKIILMLFVFSATIATSCGKEILRVSTQPQLLNVSDDLSMALVGLNGKTIQVRVVFPPSYEFPNGRSGDGIITAPPVYPKDWGQDQWGNPKVTYWSFNNSEGMTDEYGTIIIVQAFQNQQGQWDVNQRSVMTIQARWYKPINPGSWASFYENPNSIRNNWSMTLPVYVDRYGYMIGN